MNWLDVPANALAVGVGLIALLVVALAVGAWLIGAISIDGDW